MYDILAFVGAILMAVGLLGWRLQSTKNIQGNFDKAQKDRNTKDKVSKEDRQVKYIASDDDRQSKYDRSLIDRRELHNESKLDRDKKHSEIKSKLDRIIENENDLDSTLQITDEFILGSQAFVGERRGELGINSIDREMYGIDVSFELVNLDKHEVKIENIELQLSRIQKPNVHFRVLPQKVKTIRYTCKIRESLKGDCLLDDKEFDYLKIAGYGRESIKINLLSDQAGYFDLHGNIEFLLGVNKARLTHRFNSYVYFKELE